MTQPLSSSSKATDFPESSHNLRNGPKRRWFVCVAVFGVVLLISTLCFWNAGRWLVVQDSLKTADIIVVLSGGMPYRAMEAARLYNEKAAPEIWVSQPVSPSEKLSQLHIPFVGEDFYNQKVLLAMGVPVTSTRITPQPSINTEQEIEEIGRMTRDRGIQAVIIVTSAPHTRRVRTIWDRLIGNSPHLIVRHAE